MMGSCSSLPCSQEPVHGSYPEPDESNLHLRTTLLGSPKRKQHKNLWPLKHWGPF